MLSPRAQRLRELDDQDAAFRRQPNQHDEAEDPDRLPARLQFLSWQAGPGRGGADARAVSDKARSDTLPLPVGAQEGPNAGYPPRRGGQSEFGCWLRRQSIR